MTDTAADSATETTTGTTTATSAAGRRGAVAGGNAAVIARDAEHNSTLFEPDIAFVRGAGAVLTDADGRDYIDCMAGIAVASVGHGNPRLARALAEQAGKLIVCPQNLGNDTRADFLDLLFRHVRPPLTRAFLSNSGAEANEAALKWARMATGRRHIVAAKRGFAGRTLGVLPLTWEPKYREPYEPLGFRADFIAYNDLAALDAVVSDDTAAVLLETIQGEGGIHPADPAFLEGARAITKERGALLILDEIQAGVGRTGTFLAADAYGVDGDIVTLAKGLAGGFPIGATLMTDEVARAMPRGGHGTTFGGNPLASAAGLAVLREIDEHGLMQNAAAMGERLMAGLRAIPTDRVRDVRGVGLLIGLELKEKAAPIIAALRDEGVLTISAGATVIRFLPPLVIDAAQVDTVIATVSRVLRA